MSILTKLQSKQHVIEVLCRAKFKFCDHQKILTSKKWAFIKFNTGEFEDMVTEKWLFPDGCGVRYTPIEFPWTSGTFRRLRKMSSQGIA
jgi:large subunit ribosomal protein L10e